MKKYFIPLTVTMTVLLLTGCFNAKTETDIEASAEASAKEPVATTGQTVRIDMTADGFTPSEVSIKVGDTVNFVNIDTEKHWPASALHPTHLQLPGFDAIGGVEAGSTYAYTFTKAGTWAFHDHLHASLFGKVIVTE